MHHTLTMNTTDNRDRIWVTCDCGWKSDTHMVDQDASWWIAQCAARDQALAHVDEQENANP